MSSNRKHSGHNGVNDHGHDHDGQANGLSLVGHGNDGQGPNGHDGSNNSILFQGVPRFTIPVRPRTLSTSTTREPSNKPARKEARLAGNRFTKKLSLMPRQRRGHVIDFIDTVLDISPQISDTAFKRATKGSRELLASYRTVPETLVGAWTMGSARFKEGSVEYEAIRQLNRIKTQTTLGRWPTIQGGGPGAMRAAAQGAREGGADAVGVALTLQHEEAANEFSNWRCRFTKFGPRKQRMLELTLLADVYPGGFGTQDEYWEVLCMMQCQKSDRVPFYMVGAQFWREQLRTTTAAALRAGTISVKDLGLMTIVDLHRATIAAEDQMLRVMQVGEYLPGYEDQQAALRVIGACQWLRESADHLNSLNPGFDPDLHGSMVDMAISRFADIEMPADW